MDSSQTTLNNNNNNNNNNNYHINPFECLYLVFAAQLLRRLDWNTGAHTLGIQPRSMESLPGKFPEEPPVDTCLSAASRMETLETPIPSKSSSEQHFTKHDDKRSLLEPVPSNIPQLDGTENAIASNTGTLIMAAMKEHTGNTTLTNSTKRHVHKSPETCPCNACVFLRDPAYLPSELKRTNTHTTASNGVAPTAPTRASPASPVPNGKPTSPMEMPQSVASTDPKIAAQQASDMRNIVRRKLTGYVGFANLPNQWHRKSVRKGFNFNVMVVGKIMSTIHSMKRY